MYHLSIKHVYKKFKNEAVLEDVNLEFSGVIFTALQVKTEQENRFFLK